MSRACEQSSSSLNPVIFAGKDFQNAGRKENEKHSALVEVYNEKQAAEYLTR